MKLVLLFNQNSKAMGKFGLKQRRERDKVVQEWLSSGQSQPVFARENNISFHKLNYWIKETSKEEANQSCQRE